MAIAKYMSKLRFEYQSLRTGGTFHAKVLITRHYIPKALSLISFPLRLLMAVVLVAVLRAIKPLVHIRFVRLHCYSMGGFSTPMESYFCQADAGMHPKRSFDIFHHYDYPHFNTALIHPVKPKDAVCNQHLDIMYSRMIRIFEPARGLENLVRMLPRAGKHFIVILDEVDPDGLFNSFPPHLTFTEEEEEQGIARLNEMGVESGSEFVCFYAHDGAWAYRARPRLVSIYGDWVAHPQRNSTIENYLPAAETLTNLGYKAIRVGKFVEKPITPPNPHVIDYSTQFHSDLMDVYLSARCRFFLAQGGGVLGLPVMFRKPIAFVNVYPLDVLRWCSITTSNIFIPKLYYSAKKGRILSIREQVELGFVNLNAVSSRFKDVIGDLGIEILENSPDEIEEVAIEMDQTLRSEFETTAEDNELQNRFLSVITNHRNSIGLTKGREQFLKIGTKFLRRHPELLD